MNRALTASMKVPQPAVMVIVSSYELVLLKVVTSRRSLIEPELPCNIRMDLPLPKTWYMSITPNVSLDLIFSRARFLMLRES